MNVVELPVTVDGRDDIKATLRALRVNGAKVTLAAFRQFPCMDIVNEVPELLVMPIGWVNYHWKGCGPEYANFVVEYGDTVYRCQTLLAKSDVWPFVNGKHLTPLSYHKKPDWCQRWDAIVDVLNKVEQVYIAV